MQLLSAMRTVLDSHGVDTPIWNTEINYGLTGLEVEPTSRKRQVMNVVATYLLNAANGVERVYWYGWDQQLIVNTLLTEPDGATRTAAGKAFADVRDWMVGGTVARCSVDDAGTNTCTIDHPEGVRTVSWNPEETVSLTLPDAAADVHRAGGRERPADTGSTLEVGTVPVMVSTTA
jgi:hypothetical protein